MGCDKLSEFAKLMTKINDLYGLNLPSETYDLSNMSPEKMRQILSGLKELSVDLRKINNEIASLGFI
jgi:hypothetical protein